MKFGIWLDFRNPERWRQPWEQVYEETVDLAVSAEELGFESVWLSEHHLTADGYLPSLFPALAAIAARTRQVRLGTAMVLASLVHPLRLAEDAAVTDLLAGGRLELGLAPGYREQEFAALGVERAHRGARTEEAVGILRKAWTGKPFAHSGEHFTFDEVTVTPVPGRSDIPLWIGGGGKAAARRAGRHGLRFLPDLGTPPEVLEIYRETLAAHGHDPALFPVTAIVTPGVHICEDADEGWAEIKEHYHYLLNTFQEWFGAPGIPSADDLPRELFLVGPPDRVAEEIRERVKPLGDVERVIFFGRAPGLPAERARRSLAAFAEHVIPQFA
ncbi:LLM class flavin-dependent oxidoreductase [Streptomyces sp. NPDC008125]|uniref:LLM class flavin-dependent oxidoreductase n=1 Tax=Streptomyces sp. NPDC008125 TaxID=3364811 RepID=UPI0036F13F02